MKVVVTCCGKILRRGIRHGRFAWRSKPFMHEMVMPSETLMKTPT